MDGIPSITIIPRADAQPTEPSFQASTSSRSTRRVGISWNWMRIAVAIVS